MPQTASTTIRPMRTCSRENRLLADGAISRAEGLPAAARWAPPARRSSAAVRGAHVLVHVARSFIFEILVFSHYKFNG
eukprot:5032584-Prymnesium_polylepis.1